MNWAHVHIAFNHVPVIGVIFATLLLAYGLLKKSHELVTVCFGVFVIIAVLTIPVYLTGEGAEEVVERLPGFSGSVIERHAESALFSLVAILLLGGFALGGLWLFRRSNRIPAWWVTSLLILSMVVGGLVARTANLGGQIRHTEIRSDFKTM